MYCPTCGNPLAVRGNGERAYCCNCGLIFQRVESSKTWRCVATTSGNNAIRDYLNMEDEHADRLQEQQDSCDQ